LNMSLRKFIAITLITVMACLSINTVFSVAHGIEEAGITSPHDISFGLSHAETPGHCPSCPTEDHPSTDHDHFSCDHHTYVSLADQEVYRHPIPHSLERARVAEPFKFIPEVFLDKFIPPQNLA